MNNLEKILENLPKPKLSLKAGLILKSRLYYFMLAEKLARLFNPPIKHKLIFRNSLAFALVIMVIASGTSIYAYANNEITPGHSLYVLKRAVEKVEERVSLTDSLKAQAYQKFSERRLEEALHLSQEYLKDIQSGGQTEASGDIQKNIDEAVSNITSAASKVKEIKNETKAETAKNRLREKENAETGYLDEIEKNASLKQDEKLVEKINQAREAIGEQWKSLDKKENEKEKNEAGPADGGAKPAEVEKEKKEMKNSAAEETGQAEEKRTNKTEEDKRINQADSEEDGDREESASATSSREAETDRSGREEKKAETTEEKTKAE